MSKFRILVKTPLPGSAGGSVNRYAIKIRSRLDYARNKRNKNPVYPRIQRRTETVHLSVFEFGIPTHVESPRIRRRIRVR